VAEKNERGEGIVRKTDLGSTQKPFLLKPSLDDIEKECVDESE